MKAETRQRVCEPRAASSPGAEAGVDGAPRASDGGSPAHTWVLGFRPPDGGLRSGSPRTLTQNPARKSGVQGERSVLPKEALPSPGGSGVDTAQTAHEQPAQGLAASH